MKMIIISERFKDSNTKRSKRGLSGAVTALILVIASVIIALVVVGFAFGLFGALGGTPTVTQAGTGTLSYSNNEYVATITLRSTGNIQIESATISGTGVTDTAASPLTLSGGLNTVSIYFPTTNGFNPQVGSTYQITITLTDGVTVQAAVTYIGTNNG